LSENDASLRTAMTSAAAVTSRPATTAVDRLSAAFRPGSRAIELRAGASGFLLKSTQPGDLLSAIAVVADGDALLAPSVTRRLVAEFVRSSAPAPPPAGRLDGALAAITAREREVLALIASGLANAEIADRLSISPATAKTHVGHLLAKLNARDRVHLVILAYQAGIVPAG
jgi:DNA-binding NarL/FixJ family response regulator